MGEFLFQAFKNLNNADSQNADFENSRAADEKTE